MKFYSTKNQLYSTSLRDTVLKGLAPDGGLFMPKFLPKLSSAFFRKLHSLTFQDISFKIANSFTHPDVPQTTLRNIIENTINFDTPLIRLTDNMYVLELFHGPSFSFKDFGARFMAELMSYFVKTSDKELTILVATSGDTGSAVAAGFCNVPGIKVIILYPSGRVSQIQEKQLTTMGKNIIALEIKGTFDDCQKMVKQAFVDKKLNQKLQLTSANSINIVRLLPQMFYYFYSFAKLQNKDLPVVFSVPSGNFGNLTAGLFTKKMGLHISHFIAATNVNDVVPYYLGSGIFEPQSSIQTISNAMDVGNPSNFARILDLYDNDLNAMRGDIWGASFTDDQTRQAIKEVLKKHGYILDPHGAVGYLGLKKYISSFPQQANGIFLETAHPAKFPDVLEEIIDKKVPIPERLQQYLNKQKHSIKMSNNLDNFKSFLFKLD